MRWNAPLPWVVAALVVSLGGCVSEDADPKDEADKKSPEAGTPGGATTAGTTSGRLEINAPKIRPGLILSYKLDGPWSLQNSANVVIAEHNGGLLFAGKTKDDLRLDILEGSFLFGPRSADLNEVDASGNEVMRVLDFPLWDGKTWTSGDTSFTASFAADTPGTEVSIEGDGPDLLTTYVYDPAIGFVAYLKVVHKDRGDLWEARYENTDFGDTWVWYNYEAWGVAGLGDGDDVATVAIGAAAQNVYYESYGDFGTRALGLSPSGKYEPFEGFGPEHPVTRVVAAEAGDWRLTTIAQPNQSQTLWLVAVSWVPSA